MKKIIIVILEILFFLLYVLYKVATLPVIGIIVGIFVYSVSGIINFEDRYIINFLITLFSVVLGVGLLNIFYLWIIIKNKRNIGMWEFIFIAGDIGITLLVYRLESGC